MAEDFIEEIYKKSVLVNRIEEFCDFLYTDAVRTARYKELINGILPQLTEVCKDLVLNGDIEGQNIWQILTALNSYTSYMEIADVFANRILPVVKMYLMNQPKIDTEDEEGLKIFSSKTGFLTIKNKKTGKLYHSDADPMREALNKAKNLYNPEKGEYVFYGCGLGYLPYQLYMYSSKSIHISLFFSNRKSYEYANLYGVLSWIPEEAIDIYIDDDIKNFLDVLSNTESEYFIFTPELEYLMKELAGMMRGLVDRQCTLINVKEYSLKNMNCNLRNVGKFISEYDKSKIKNRIIVIAGGPSVDDNIEFIKNNKKEMSVICAGTVFKKLLEEGIVPDIVSVLDPFESTLPQLSNIDKCDTVLFSGLDAYWRTVSAYSGEKYLVAMDDDLGNQKKVAALRGETVLPACTTVSVMAFNIAAYLGAEEIYLIGADFAYPKGKSHASATAEATVLDTSGMIQTIDVNGEMVFTTDKMLDYKAEMEEAIDATSVKCFNLSTGGARIKGAEIVR